MPRFLIDDAPDHGNDLGIAHHLRPSEVVDLEAVSRGTVQPGQRVLVKRMKVECEVDRLCVNGQITDPQWRAGILFRFKWLACVKLQRVSASYGETVSGRGDCNPTDDIAARRATAKADVNAAIAALGMLRSNAVIAVCGMDESARGRVRLLREGLDELRALYAVPADYERGQTRGR